MTENKPIYVNGIDVSGCEDYGYRGSAGYWCHNYDEPCTDYPNCNFKQLARKTQECEELKELLNSKCFDTKSNNNRCISYNRIAEDYKKDLKQLDQLKAEKEELQYQLRCVTGREKGYRKNSDFWEKRYEKLKEQFFQLKAENEKLKNIIQKSANSFCNDYVEAIENYDKLKEELTHIQHNCTREGCKYYDNEDYKVFYRCKAEQKLEKIEKISKDFHYAIIPFHRGINHEIADRIDYYLNQILQIIDEVK